MGNPQFSPETLPCTENVELELYPGHAVGLQDGSITNMDYSRRELHLQGTRPRPEAIR